jgi:hypothetical protein
MKTGTLLAIIVFIVVALAHLYRLVTGAELLLNGNIVPQWISVPGVLLPGLIAWLLWKESK